MNTKTMVPSHLTQQELDEAMIIIDKDVEIHSDNFYIIDIDLDGVFVLTVPNSEMEEAMENGCNSEEEYLMEVMTGHNMAKYGDAEKPIKILKEIIHRNKSNNVKMVGM